ncbi:MAG: hypothetical protein IJF14_04375 [Clostridia bacterium]|nr:hypothetical protein [Clostridia bacterium]
MELVEDSFFTHFALSALSPFQLIQRKKSKLFDLLFFGAAEGTNLLCRFIACPPKCFAFRYRTSHQKAKNLPQATFLTLFALSGSSPFQSIRKAKRVSLRLTPFCFGAAEGT